jgi:hypothetical protein
MDGKLKIKPDYFMAEDMDSDSVTVTAAGTAETDDAEVYFSATFICSYEIEWEPDSDPTYVPYGSRMVLFDKGEGGIEDVDVTDIDIDIDGWEDDDGNEITGADVAKILGVSADAVEKAILDEMKSQIITEAERYAEKHAEKPEADDPRW